MSEQFRLTVRQLFSSKLLFVPQAQATFHGGKRYSLILVDVEKQEENKRAKAKSSFLQVNHRPIITRTVETTIEEASKQRVEFNGNSVD